VWCRQNAARAVRSVPVRSTGGARLSAFSALNAVYHVFDIMEAVWCA